MTRSRVVLPLPFLMLLSASCAALPRPPRTYTIEQFKKTVQFSGASFSHDGARILFNSNESGVYNAYVADVRSGAVTPVITSKGSLFARSFFPTDDRMLFTRDDGGDENNHLLVRTPAGADVDLTPGPNVRATFLGWDASGSALYFRSNARDAKVMDVYRADAATLATAMIYRNDAADDVACISGDGRWIALTKAITTNRSEIDLVDVAGGRMQAIVAATAQNDPQAFEGDALDYVTDEGSEFRRVRRYDIATGRIVDVAAPAGEVENVRLSPRGRFRITAINANARSTVEIADGRRTVTLPASSATISPDESRVAYYAESDRSPADLYVRDLATGATRRLTHSLNPEIDPADLADGADVRFRSFDGLEIPAILYAPRGASARAKSPAIVWVHGGPGGEMTHGYFSLVQYLVNHGYVFLGVNNRGSSGYGKSFLAADDRRHGHEPLRDCLAARDYLARLPYVDGARIAIGGESYGGYMTLAALAFAPDAFAAGVDFYGPSNWIHTLEAIPPYWESYRKALIAEIGDPVADRAMLESISPFFHAANIRRPLMVVQGARDPRVPRADTDSMVEAIRKNGVEVEYRVFADEGHGLTKREDQIVAFGAMLEFLDRELKRAR